MLSFMAPKVVSHISQPMFIEFHIEIANDAFQFLNCVKIKKRSLRLFCKLNYSFVAIAFWCFS